MIHHYASFHGGLGDYLQMSTIPEELTKQGHTVHLWEKAVFRNPGIRDLVLMNPYILPPIKGGVWSLGDIPGLPYMNTQRSFIGNWEAMFGILPPVNTLPKIYYQPKGDKMGQLKHAEFGGVIELSAISLKYNQETVFDQIVQLVLSRKDVHWLQLVGGHQSNPIIISGIPQVKIKDIFHLCDVVANCKIFVSLNSGTHALGAAIQRINPHYEQYCFLPRKDAGWIMDAKKFIFPNVEYLIA